MVRFSLVFLMLILSAGRALAVLPGGVYRDHDALAVQLDPNRFPHSLGYHLMRGTTIYHGRKIPFSSGIFLPAAFFQAKNPMPIVMTLHNRMAIGRDGSGAIVEEGLAHLLAYGQEDGRAQGDRPDNPLSLRQDAQFIGLVPQCPAGFTWEDPVMTKMLVNFIDQVVAHYHADDDRVYLTGFSYGASSTWRVALNAPDRFAAIICCDGRATPDPTHDVEKLKNLPIYLEVGQWDGDFVAEADRMHQALDTLPHRNFIFHMIPGGNHFNYGAVYEDPAVWQWVFAQHRIHANSTTQPVNPETAAAAR